MRENKHNVETSRYLIKLNYSTTVNEAIEVFKKMGFTDIRYNGFQNKLNDVRIVYTFDGMVILNQINNLDGSYRLIKKDRKYGRFYFNTDLDTYGDPHYNAKNIFDTILLK